MRVERELPQSYNPCNCAMSILRICRQDDHQCLSVNVSMLSQHYVSAQYTLWPVTH